MEQQPLSVKASAVNLGHNKDRSPAEKMKKGVAVSLG